jgi:flagellar basal-body rod protein FlgC
MKYQPSHPDADSEGYVRYPNVDMTSEMVDAMQATRAYEANVGVLEISKDITQQSLRIIA